MAMLMEEANRSMQTCSASQRILHAVLFSSHCASPVNSTLLTLVKLVTPPGIM